MSASLEKQEDSPVKSFDVEASVPLSRVTVGSGVPLSHVTVASESSWRQVEQNGVHEDAVWTFKTTIAFWAAVYFINGSAFFVVGSLGLYPGVSPDHEYERAWVEYPYMIGAWCFTAANYLVYFQVINRLNSHGASSSQDANKVRKTCWFLPHYEDINLGYLAALCNIIGAICYNFNTNGMFGTWVEQITGYNVGYVMTGAVGSLWFCLGAIFEGEYNNWRKLSYDTLSNLAVLMSYFSFFGGVLFFIGYASDYDKFVSGSGPLKDFRVTWYVASPFFVGSCFFFAGSWISQLMWKRHMFGLGFAEELTDAAATWTVDWKQQIMLVVYCANICISLLVLGKLVTADGQKWFSDVGSEVWLAFNVVVRVLGYNVVIGLATVVHATPTECPYPCLFWGMRLTAVIDCVGMCLWLAHENPYLFHGSSH